MVIIIITIIAIKLFKQLLVAVTAILAEAVLIVSVVVEVAVEVVVVVVIAVVVIVHSAAITTLKMFIYLLPDFSQFHECDCFTKSQLSPPSNLELDFELFSSD